MLKKLKQLQFTERQRTIVLIFLLAIAVGFIYWTKNSYSDNFTDTF